MKRITLLFIFCVGLTAHAQNAFFTKTGPSANSSGQDNLGQEQIYTLNSDGLYTVLDEVDSRNTAEEFLLTLPDVNGQSSQYRMVEASVMEDDFQANYPAIRTYKGQSLTNPPGNFKI